MSEHTPFEKFLMDKHSEGYVGTDDTMPDAFDEWVAYLTGDEWIKYTNEFNAKLIAQETVRVRRMGQGIPRGS